MKSIITSPKINRKFMWATSPLEPDLFEPISANQYYCLWHNSYKI